MSAIAYPLGSGEGEEIALVAGLRPMIRQLLRADDLDRARARFERLGFVTDVAPRAYGPTHEGWDDTPDASAIDPKQTRRALFVGRDRVAIGEAIKADLAKSDDGDRSLGRRLGYPRCCVEAFVDRGKHRKNAEVIEATLRATEGRPAARLNVLDLAVFHWISWMPCTFRCAWSLKYADALAEIVGKRHAAFVREIDAALGAHRLYLGDDVQLSMRGVFDGEAIAIEEAWATARDRHPRAATLDERAREETARLLDRVRTGTTLRVREDELWIDGARADVSSRPLLGTFGEWKSARAT